MKLITLILLSYFFLNFQVESKNDICIFKNKTDSRSYWDIVNKKGYLNYLFFKNGTCIQYYNYRKQRIEFLPDDIFYDSLYWKVNKDTLFLSYDYKGTNSTQFINISNSKQKLILINNTNQDTLIYKYSSNQQTAVKQSPERKLRGKTYKIPD